MHPAVEASDPQAALPEVVPPLPAVRPLAAAGWMLLSTLCFAGMALCARRASRDLPFHEVAAARAGIGALVIWVVARLRGQVLAVRDRSVQWRRTIAGTIAMGCGFFALSRLAVGDSVTLASLSPILLAVVSSRVLGERPGLTVWLGVALGFAGVVSIAGAQLAVSSTQFAAVLVGVLGAAASCVAMIYLRRLGTETPEAVAFHFALWSSVAMLAIGVGRHVLPDTLGWLLLVGAGVTGAFGQVSLTRAYANDEAARVGALSYVGIVVNLVLAGVVLGEVPNAAQVLGAKLVLVAGVITMLGAAPRGVVAKVRASLASVRER